MYMLHISGNVSLSDIVASVGGVSIHQLNHAQLAQVYVRDMRHAAARDMTHAAYSPAQPLPVLCR